MSPISKNRQQLKCELTRNKLQEMKTIQELSEIAPVNFASVSPNVFCQRMVGTKGFS